MNQDSAADSSIPSFLEREYDYLEKIYLAADLNRIRYHEQLDALHDAVKVLGAARGHHHTQKAFEALLALCDEQRETN